MDDAWKARLMARVRNADRLSVRLRGVSKAVEDEVFKGVFAAGDMVAKEAALSITRGSISGKGHVPSAPGEPPNADTRQLDTNIVTVPDRPNLAVRVVSEAPYSAHLEFGTAKMAPRPFLRPALRENKAAAVALIERTVKKATGKG